MADRCEVADFTGTNQSDDRTIQEAIRTTMSMIRSDRDGLNRVELNFERLVEPSEIMSFLIERYICTFSRALPLISAVLATSLYKRRDRREGQYSSYGKNNR